MKIRLIPLLAALLCSAASTLVAQTASAPDAATLAKYDKNHNGKLDPDEIIAMQADEKETVQLSQFEVRTDQDRGYQASNAGTGGRIDLEYKMAPTALSAMTKEFLEDWDITDMRQSFKYAMNVDRANNSNENSSPFGDFQYNFLGVGDAGNYPTRNYFLYYGNSDAYNAERFEFSRGPNSVLFGDGQIGGLATTLTKQARLTRDAYEAVVRYDSWGGLRFTNDSNKVLTDKQALRLNLMYQRNAFGAAWRDGARSDDKAIDLAYRYAVTPNTTIRTEVEFARLKRFNFSATYFDQFGYYAPGSYVYDGTNPVTGAAATAAGVTAVSTNAQNWTYIPDEPGLGLVNTGNSKFFRANGPTIAIQPNGRSDMPGMRQIAKLPSREFNMGPNDSWSRYKYQVYSVYLDHNFADNVFGQIAFYDYNNDRNQTQSATATFISQDVNKFLPDGVTPNPKVGQYYAETGGLTKPYQENYVYEWRALATWKTKLPLQGRMQLSGIAGWRAERFEARSLTLFRVDGPNQTWTAAENSLRLRYYLDDGLKYPAVVPHDSPGFTYRYEQNGFASIEHKDIEYIQAVAATSFLDDRISLLLGARNDDLTDDQIGNISSAVVGQGLDAHGLNNFGGFVPGVGTVQNAHNLTKAGAFTYNFGGVGWLDRGKHVGVFYNFSKNFAPPTSGAAKIIGFNPDGTINGAAFGATTGHSREYGLKFNFLEDRIAFEARRYDSEQVDQISTPPVGNITSAWTSAGASYNSNTNLTAMNFRDVAALTAKGYEFQVTANVLGVRLSANYALPQTASKDVRPVTLAYANYWIPIWQKWANDGKNDKGDILSSGDISNLNTQILNLQNNIAGSAPGTTVNGTNKYTGSIAANYSFPRESSLKGVSFGLGESIRGPRKNGSVNPQILYNLPNITGNNVNPTPQQNHDAAFAYLYSPSYWTMDANVSYQRRIGKYNCRFQLNVANLTDKRDLIFTGYTTFRPLGDATQPFVQSMLPSGYNPLDPRKVSLTTSVAF